MDRRLLSTRCQRGTFRLLKASEGGGFVSHHLSRRVATWTCDPYIKRRPNRVGRDVAVPKREPVPPRSEPEAIRCKRPWRRLWCSHPPWLHRPPVFPALDDQGVRPYLLDSLHVRHLSRDQESRTLPMRRRHELYIAASTTAVDHFVKNVSQVLGLPRTDVELRLESLLRQLFPRLARSP